MITDESATVVKEKKYEAFGNIVWEEGIHDDNREFTGKEKESTGFHYFGARRYYGNIGRFLSPDPHTVSPELLHLANPQTLNPYVYCHNDPVNYFDPWGLYEEDFDRPDKYYEGEGVTVIGRRDNFDAYTWYNNYQFFNQSYSAGPTNSSSYWQDRTIERSFANFNGTNQYYESSDRHNLAGYALLLTMADGPVIPIGDIVAVAIILGEGVYAINKVIQLSKTPNVEPYPGAMKGKRVKMIDKSTPEMAHPKGNPPPPPPTPGKEPWWMLLLRLIHPYINKGK